MRRTRRTSHALAMALATPTRRSGSPIDPMIVPIMPRSFGHPTGRIVRRPPSTYDINPSVANRPRWKSISCHRFDSSVLIRRYWSLYPASASAAPGGLSIRPGPRAGPIGAGWNPTGSLTLAANRGAWANTPARTSWHDALADDQQVGDTPNAEATAGSSRAGKQAASATESQQSGYR